MGHTIYEWVYIGVVVGILIWVGADSWLVEKHLEEIPEEATTIRVVAQQWFWTFEHPDGTKEVGELHVKAGKAYRFEVVSKDVIHSFNVPYFVMTMDAVPGRVNKIWFAPAEPGEFLIQCREYCGLLHYQMRAKLIVEA
ncbi:MAG: cupredoxin domain-containing protein [Nitrososphaerales archaeon]